MMKEEVVQFLQEEVAQNHIPGAVIQVQHENKTILEEAVGYRAIYEEEATMTLETQFDLASLTKVVATTTAFLYLLDQGEIRLEDKVIKFIPEFSAHEKSAITLRHLLTHTSGLQANLPLKNKAYHNKAVQKIICQLKLENPIGKKVVYSDVNFALLFLIAEKITQQPFEQFLQHHIFKPLNMINTGYNLDQKAYEFAKTEYAKHLKTYKNGIVHDENTERMGGISGHAGLFSNIEDLGKYAQMINEEGSFAGKQILSPHSIHLSRQNFTPFDSLHRGIGWELNGLNAASAGDYFPKESFGHTGFTGTSMWFDPTINLSVILLTNRVHFGRQSHILSLRPRLHNIIRKYFPIK